MTKKEFRGNLLISIIGLLSVVLMGTINNSKERGFLSRGYSEPYSIVFDANTNRIATQDFVNPATGHNGTGIAKTGLDNAVTFDYVNFTNQGGMWQNIRAGGSLTNTQPISGMTKLTIVKRASAANLKVYWSNSQTFDESRSIAFDTTSPLTIETTFDDYKPNYIKLTTLAQSAIDSMLIEFDCSDYYPSVDVYSSSSLMGSVSGGGLHNVGTNVTLSATPNTGYQFIGWFQNNILLSTDSQYSFIMPFESMTIEGRFSVNTYNLVVMSENENKGTVTGTGTYDYNEEVEISATPNEGYSFDGWYANNALISTEATLNFNMPANALNYVAKFNPNPYVITLQNENPESGTISGANTYDYTQSVSLNAVVNPGYSFVGWFEGESLISSANPFTFSMPHRNLDYVAKFSVNSYELTITSNDVNKGSVYESGSGTYAYASEVTITAIEEEGHQFIGWYEDGVLISINSTYIFTMPYRDLDINAEFVTKYEVIAEDWSGGLGVVYGSGQYGYGTTVTVTAVPNEGYYFEMWYDDIGVDITSSATYTFTMPGHDVYLGATFTDFIPLQAGDIYSLGLYPQTKVTDSTTISTLNDSSGILPTSANSQSWTSYNYYISGSNTTNFMWYKDISVGEDLYRGVYFTSYRPYYTTSSSSTSNSYQDDNGYFINTRYWFKFEPISWDVLSVNEVEGPLVLSSKIIDSQEYYHSTSNRTIDSETIYPNNYKESNIRTWLNDGFLNTAFSSTEQNLIKTTNVDNGVYSTGYSTNQYATTNTDDKLFLPSYREVVNADYGFSTSENSHVSRVRSSTDYAKAMGVYVDSSSGNPIWRLRSPYNLSAYGARLVYYDGYIINDYVYRTGSGLLPAFRINR